MTKQLIFLLAAALLFSCSKGITKSRVCALEEGFNPLKGCSKNIKEFNGAPETVIFSFQASGVSRDSKVTMEWYFDEQGRYHFIDSFSYYIKSNQEQIVSGIDRNFLQPGEYLIKTKIRDEEQTFEHEQRFTINADGKPSAHLLLVGSAVDPNGLVIKPNIYFDVNHARVFVSTYIFNAVPNGEIKINFVHTDGGKYSKSFNTQVGPKPKPKFLLYAYLPNIDLPMGEYRVEIDLGTEVFSAPFYIDASQQSVKPENESLELDLP
jgi:hypothetical protein